MLIKYNDRLAVGRRMTEVTRRVENTLQGRPYPGVFPLNTVSNRARSMLPPVITRPTFL
jgi:hypothetical protein